MTACVLIAVMVFVVGLTGSCTRGTATTSRIIMNITPKRALADAPIGGSISGLFPGERVVLTATAKDRLGNTWKAVGRFRATDAGTVSLDQRVEAGSSWTGSDALGPLMMMKPVHPGRDVPKYFSYPDDDLTIHLVAASVDGTTSTQEDLLRRMPWNEDISGHDLVVSDDGVSGRVHHPTDTSTLHPAVLIFDGGDNGPDVDYQAELLAAHGYTTLQLDYVGADGLPKTANRIPLEYFTKALRLLRSQPGVDAHRIVIWSSSFGSEAALLVASDFPGQVAGVVAISPGATVANPGTTAPSPWTLHGKPLPAALPDSIFDYNLPSTIRALIPVQKIDASVLLICGEEDLWWESCQATDQISQTMTAAGHAPEVVRYAQAGHYVDMAACCPSDNRLEDGVSVTGGGDEQQTLAAAAAAWQRALVFIRDVRPL